MFSKETAKMQNVQPLDGGELMDWILGKLQQAQIDDALSFCSLGLAVVSENAVRASVLAPFAAVVRQSGGKAPDPTSTKASSSSVYLVELHEKAGAYVIRAAWRSCQSGTSSGTASKVMHPSGVAWSGELAPETFMELARAAQASWSGVWLEVSSKLQRDSVSTHVKKGSKEHTQEVATKPLPDRPDESEDAPVQSKDISLHPPVDVSMTVGDGVDDSTFENSGESRIDYTLANRPGSIIDPRHSGQAQGGAAHDHYNNASEDARVLSAEDTREDGSNANEDEQEAKQKDAQEDAKNEVLSQGKTKGFKQGLTSWFRSKLTKKSDSNVDVASSGNESASSSHEASGNGRRGGVVRDTALQMPSLMAFRDEARYCKTQCQQALETCFEDEGSSSSDLHELMICLLATAEKAQNSFELSLRLLEESQAHPDFKLENAVQLAQVLTRRSPPSNLGAKNTSVSCSASMSSPGLPDMALRVAEILLQYLQSMSQRIESDGMPREKEELLQASHALSDLVERYDLPMRDLTLQLEHIASHLISQNSVEQTQEQPQPRKRMSRQPQQKMHPPSKK